MIAVRKLLSLSPQHCARKASQTLAVLEARARDGDYSAGPWLSELAHALSKADWIEPPLASLCVSIIGDMQQAGCEPDGLNYTRSINRLRRGLEAFAGVSPADWDFSQPLGLGLDGRARAVFPGMMAYLEDIRSPFNVGSAFRTADAFGLAGIVLGVFALIGFIPLNLNLVAMIAFGAITLIAGSAVGDKMMRLLTHRENL